MPRFRDEHGFALPARLMVVSISAVALGGLAFVATQGDDGDAQTAQVAAEATSTATATPSPSDAPSTAPEVEVSPAVTPTAAPTVDKAKANVVVFNNSNIKGLAGKTATRAQGAGWTVIGSDNWYGSVDASTVYYGDKLKPAALLLAKDLGIASVKPAIKPMRSDRLTVILTADYQ